MEIISAFVYLNFSWHSAAPIIKLFCIDIFAKRRRSNEITIYENEKIISSKLKKQNNIRRVRRIRENSFEASQESRPTTHFS